MLDTIAVVAAAVAVVFAFFDTTNQFCKVCFSFIINLCLILQLTAYGMLDKFGVVVVVVVAFFDTMSQFNKTFLGFIIN